MTVSKITVACIKIGIISMSLRNNLGSVYLKQLEAMTSHAAMFIAKVQITS